MGKWTGASLIPLRLTGDPSPLWIGRSCRRVPNSNGYLLFRSGIISWTFVVILPSEPEHVHKIFAFYKFCALLAIAGSTENRPPCPPSSSYRRDAMDVMIVRSSGNDYMFEEGDPLAFFASIRPIVHGGKMEMGRIAGLD